MLIMLFPSHDSRGKRHDYFTSALPWPQKGDSVSIPLFGDAQIYGDGSPALFVDQSGNQTYIKSSGTSVGMAVQTTGVTDASTPFGFAAVPQGLFDASCAICLLRAANTSGFNSN